MKLRVRFGVTLPWPVRNAGTFVSYLTQAQYNEAKACVASLKIIFPVVGSRLFVEWTK